MVVRWEERTTCGARGEVGRGDVDESFGLGFKGETAGFEGRDDGCAVGLGD